jgi:hypothetical protein
VPKTTDRQPRCPSRFWGAPTGRPWVSIDKSVSVKEMSSTSREPRGWRVRGSEGPRSDRGKGESEGLKAPPRVSIFQEAIAALLPSRQVLLRRLSSELTSGRGWFHTAGRAGRGGGRRAFTYSTTIGRACGVSSRPLHQLLSLSKSLPLRTSNCRSGRSLPLQEYY